MSFLTPRYLIKVEGTKLNEDITNYINSVEYEESENQASKITLNVINDKLRFIDSKVFAEGNNIDLWIGYVGKPLYFMNRGIIVKPNPSFPRNGIPKINVIAHDISRKLMDTIDNDKGKTYKKKRDSEIAEDIYQSVGIAPFTFQTKGLKTRTRKRGTVPWKFLKKLASLHNYIISVKYDPKDKINYGYFGPSDYEEQDNKYNLKYGTGEQDSILLDFYPNLSLPSQKTKVQIVYTDIKNRKTHRLTVDVTGKKSEKTKFVGAEGNKKLKKEIENGSTIKLTVFGQSEEVVIGKSFKDVKEAKRFASAWFKKRENEFAFGRGTVLGLPDLRKGQVHELTGIGNRLSGDWQITSVNHRLSNDSVYLTEFFARKIVLDSVIGSTGNVSNVEDKEEEQ